MLCITGCRVAAPALAAQVRRRRAGCRNCTATRRSQAVLLRAGGVAAPGEAEEAEQVPVAHAGGVHGALGPAKVAAEGGDLWVGGALRQGGWGAGVGGRTWQGKRRRTVPGTHGMRMSWAAWMGLQRRAGLLNSRHSPLPCVAPQSHLLGGVGGGGEHAARAAVVARLGRQAEEALRCGWGKGEGGCRRETFLQAQLDRLGHAYSCSEPDTAPARRDAMQPWARSALHTCSPQLSPHEFFTM